MGNTHGPGMVIDIKTRQPILDFKVGGLSGPAIKPVALYMVYKVFEVIEIPVIGCGGILSAEDALEFLMAGASAVQIGTANMVDPGTVLNILDGIARFMEEQNINTINEVIGIAHSSS